MKKTFLVGSLALFVTLPLGLELSSLLVHAQEVRIAQSRTNRYEIPHHPGRHKYGAIAFSKSTGNWGTSYNFKSRAAAEQDALTRCAAGDCDVKIWFRNACGALAVGKGNCMGSAWAKNRAAAERKALEWCRRAGEDCSVKCWACTDR
jgi:hypothetical protein